MKDVCLSVANNSCVTSQQNGNEDAAVQNKSSKAQQNQRQSNQNHRYQRPPVVTDEEYSDSSGGLYNDYVSNSSVSTFERKNSVMSKILFLLYRCLFHARNSFKRTPHMIPYNIVIELYNMLSYYYFLLCLSSHVLR